MSKTVRYVNTSSGVNVRNEPAGDKVRAINEGALLVYDDYYKGVQMPMGRLHIHGSMLTIITKVLMMIMSWPLQTRDGWHRKIPAQFPPLSLENPLLFPRTGTLTRRNS